jgi:septal ring factor EnvC (AmiA/AmiB activator)
VTDILHLTGIDPASRKEIEIEQEAWRTIEAMFAPREKKLLKELDEKNKALSEKEKELEAQRKLIEELKKKLDK